LRCSEGVKIIQTLYIEKVMSVVACGFCTDGASINKNRPKTTNAE